MKREFHCCWFHTLRWPVFNHFVNKKNIMKSLNARERRWSDLIARLILLCAGTSNGKGRSHSKCPQKNLQTAYLAKDLLSLMLDLIYSPPITKHLDFYYTHVSHKKVLHEESHTVPFLRQLHNSYKGRKRSRSCSTPDFYRKKGFIAWSIHLLSAKYCCGSAIAYEHCECLTAHSKSLVTCIEWVMYTRACGMQL
jgi:hypothetical protein